MKFIEQKHIKTKSKESSSSREVPKEFTETLILMNYCEATIKSYKQHLLQLFNYYPDLAIDEISQDQIKKYLLYLVEKKKYSSSAQNQAINAIKFYYEKVLGEIIEKSNIPRPRNGKILPKSLSENDVKLILTCIDDIRIKCMVFFVYSAGLTPSEVTFLKISDIDSKTMKVFISSRNGDKDRYVNLSEKLLIILRDYYRKYKPEYWLFEAYKHKQFSKRTLQDKFQEAVKRSKISKRATLTILKNSFATHLIEKGVDIRFVQQMLGHKSTKTTMKYLKISKRDLKAIKSPLDELDI